MTQGYRREPNWYMNDGTYNRLSRAAIVTLAHMAKLMHGGKWCGSVSTNRLVELTGLGRSSVCRALTELRDAGILERETGQHAYEINTDPRPTGGTDCSTGGTPDVPRVAHARPTGGTSVSHGWDSHPYSSKTYSKNTLQEGERDPVMVMHKGKQVSPYHSAAPLLTATGWPENRWCGETGVRAITKALVRISDGCEGESAASDPVQWLGARMNAAAKSTDDPRFVPKITKWLEENYPHLISEGEPAQ
jgi:hypothetical protein